MQNNSVQPGGQGQNNQQGNQAPKQSGLSWSQPAQTGTKPVSPLQITPTKPITPPYVQKNTPKTTNKRFLGILAGGILIGFLVGWAWFASRPDAVEEGVVTTDTETTADETASNSTKPTTISNTVSSGQTATAIPAAGVMGAADDTVSVPTPQAPGSQVLISGFVLSKPTWIVVYDNKNGVRGNALGAALFNPTTKGWVIHLSLLRATVPNQSYFVGRNVDNGDKIFSLQQDGPVVDAAGKPIYQTFEVRN